MSATLDMLLMNPQVDAAAEHTQATAVEAVLVRAVLEGDRDGFAQLDGLYAPFKKLHTLRDGSAFGPWIAMIARNRAVDFHRRSKATVELNDEIGGSNTQDSKAKEILELIRNLPEAYRETLVLRLVEGMTGPEIAARTGLTAASVRVNLHRGMKLLRERLGFMEAL